jgi:hypothetical protein
MGFEDGWLKLESTYGEIAFAKRETYGEEFLHAVRGLESK